MPYGQNVSGSPVEHDEENAYARRKAEETLFGEAIRFDFSKLERAHGILLVLIASVEWGQIQIGGG